ncbi:glycoside hydrolase family 65 protein [Microbacterium stercoris]|uniref:Glycoside hydrolase family 65 protein n=1 Tax=Microbacterium stercoris TaxID=2820289 RepID=A0A939TW79_9MICO|nr:glycosyl hydrolase family 65 protein [Microbacterium stercoris]MBO3662357.1 glycoside hydrolase family 65 protein [Microbacterium stercoris]MBO3664349.1 glycoside hydrolase family 65 protein [Microbacterium stercoris]
MTRPLPFDVAPWSLGLSGFDEHGLAHRESVFSLSNGHLGWRGNPDEGDPHRTPGSYLNGFFERHPMPYAEDGYGYPDAGQSVINVPDGKILRLFVDDEPFDIRHGRVIRHEQRLDFRAGTLTREIEWTSPAGRTVEIVSTRLVSLTHRSVAAVRYEVRAGDGPCAITVQSEIVANEPLTEVHPDPRVKEALAAPLESLGDHLLGTRATLVHVTRRSRLGVAVAMDHVVRCTGGPPVIATETSADLARTTIRADLNEGDRLDIVKVVGHEWSDSPSATELRDRADAAVIEALGIGWDELVAAQRAYLDEYWACADVLIEGEPRLQQAVRFALFHVCQAAARLESRSIPGKGLTGAGYQGHTFWDSETFVLPVLTSTAPASAAQALRWRHATLGHARERATQLGLKGAVFAWRTIDGQESSGYWPASMIAFHLGADIAAAVRGYVRATGDEEFEREAGLEILVETARMWVSLGRWDDAGLFHIDGVTGPDEYSAMTDDNTYTNLSAKANLEGAVDAALRHPDVSEALGVSADEIDDWRRTAEGMTIPFNERLGVHEPSAGFTSRELWDFASSAPDRYPLQEHFPYFDLYRKQVIKQADLVLALYTAHEAFTQEEKARAFTYCEALTVRDSSLSAGVQSVIAAEVGQLELAADYLAEAATLDLDDLQGDTADGLHIASLASLWTAITAGIGGMRHGVSGLRFAPRLPAQLSRVSFGIRIGGRTLHLDITPETTLYRLTSGPELGIEHFGRELVLRPGAETTAANPPAAAPGPRPAQPASRAPRPFSTAFAP